MQSRLKVKIKRKKNVDVYLRAFQRNNFRNASLTLFFFSRYDVVQSYSCKRSRREETPKLEILIKSPRSFALGFPLQRVI